MAAGAAKIGAITSVAASASLSIQPTGTDVWLLKNIAYGGAVEVYLSDGTNAILIDSDAAAGQMIGMAYLLSNTQYMTVKNTGASAINIRYDAIQWS